MHVMINIEAGVHFAWRARRRIARQERDDPATARTKKMERKRGKKEMKTKVIAGIVALLFLASTLNMAFVLTARAHTEGDPYVTKLIAGQNIDAGPVLVWNDGTNLYVRALGFYSVA